MLSSTKQQSRTRTTISCSPTWWIQVTKHIVLFSFFKTNAKKKQLSEIKSDSLRNTAVWNLAKLAQLTQNQDKRQEAIEKHVTCGHRCSEPRQTGARTGFTKCRCSTETNILISSGPATVITLACCYVASVQTEKKTEVLHTEIKVQPPSDNADFSFSF